MHPGIRRCRQRVCILEEGEHMPDHVSVIDQDEPIRKIVASPPKGLTVVLPPSLRYGAAGRASIVLPAFSETR
jgi:hypothetical protein